MGRLALSRRSLLGRLGGLVAAPRVLFGGAVHARDHALEAQWLATAGVEGGFAPVVLSPDYTATAVGTGGQRLHWVEPSPDGRTAVAVARRPGTTAVLFDRQAGAVLATFEPGAGRVFSGHGRFIEGGRRFLAVEIERASGQGVVTRRVVEADFAIEAEWASSGLGPHDMLPAGGTLVVANGGVEPHTPEAVGAEIAGASVALLDPVTGETRSVAALGDDLASLSLRHLASGPGGPTVVAAQDLLADGVARPLLYAVEGESLRAFDAPEEELRRRAEAMAAAIGPGAEVGAGSVICANAVVGAGVRIGRDSTIGAGVSLSHALVGNRVIVHAGARIGQDGFGYQPGPGGHLKVPQIGRVVLQDDVEIGAGSTIDRGALRDTVIGEGTKIDNLVQIAHNVVIGRHCIIVSQTGISGSTTLGDFVMLGGQVGVVGHCTIGDGAQIAASSNVKGDVPPGVRWGGSPAKPVREWFREMTTLKKLAESRARSGAATPGEEE